MTALFVGVDLGGSGTRAALVEGDGTVLATGRGPTGLLGGVAARPAAGRRHMARALDAALAPIAARVGGEPCVVYAGSRGLSVRGRREALELELKLRFASGEVHVSNDALTGLWGGLAGQPGVAVVAGAGSIALARSADGREGRAGGWGYLLGDEGSGYWIGREGLLGYLRCLEGRDKPGILADLCSSSIGRSTVVEVLGWFYTGQDQVERLAALAPLVAQAADRGDATAIDILGRAGAALAELAGAAAHQVWPQGVEPLEVVCVGGLWSAGRALTDAFERALMPGARRRPPRLPPVGGAILLGMRADQVPPPTEVVARLGDGLAGSWQT